MVLVGHRLLTFLGLTSLAATMLMLTRYNLSADDGNHHLRKLIKVNIPQQPQQLSAKQSQSTRDGHHALKLASSAADNGAADDSKDTVRNAQPRLRAVDMNNNQANQANNLAQVSSDGIVFSSPTSALLKPAAIASSTSPSSSSTLSSKDPSPDQMSKTDTSKSQSQSANNATTESTTVKPKTVFDARDLKSTESFLIDKPLFCDADKGATLDLLVVVTSAVSHFDARQAIRRTWGQFAVERGALVLFLLGATTDGRLQDQVLAEEAANGDLLQGSFVDNYYNLTLKTISLMRWVNDTCNQVKYVLKVDDDMFVNMQMMVDFSETRTFNKAIIGKLARKWRPHRDPKSKWFVPITAFNGTLYPNFATGESTTTIS